jgi:hypothetical protein
LDPGVADGAAHQLVARLLDAAPRLMPPRARPLRFQGKPLRPSSYDGPCEMTDPPQRKAGPVATSGRLPLIANLRHLADRLGLDVGGRIELGEAVRELADVSEAASTWKPLPERAAGYRSRPQGVAALA